jgi:hypothetical protein
MIQVRSMYNIESSMAKQATNKITYTVSVKLLYERYGTLIEITDTCLLFLNKKYYS